jgi:hypothetical protein
LTVSEDTKPAFAVIFEVVNADIFTLNELNTWLKPETVDVRFGVVRNPAFIIVVILLKYP